MTFKIPQIIGLSIILDILVLDQLSKWWVMEHVFRPEMGGTPLSLIEWIMNAPNPLQYISIPIMPYFNLTMVWNRGVSFGMMQDMGIWPLTVLALAISAFLTVWIFRSTSKFESIALGMIIGGAIGNVVDRLRFGGVADFLDIYVGTYHWPSFNIADSAITIGVVLLLIQGMIMSDNKEVR